MVIRASEEMNIDPKRSYIVGDMLKDIQAAGRVGAKAILVRTGYGLNTIKKDLIIGSADMVQPHYIAEDILDAVKWIIQDRKQ